MMNTFNYLLRSVRRWSGLASALPAQDLTEYGILVSMIAILVVIAIAFFGNDVLAFFVYLGEKIGIWLAA